MAETSGSNRRDTDRIRDEIGRAARRPTIKLPEPAAEYRVVVFTPMLELGGVSLYARTLLRTLRDRGDTLMLVSRGGPLLQTMTAMGIETFEIPAGRIGYFGRKRLNEALQSFGPNVLHAVSPQDARPAVRAADLLEVPLVVSVHGIKPAELPVPGDKLFDAYISSDQSVRERLLNDCRLERDRTTLIGDSVHADSPPNEAAILNPRRRQVTGWIGPLFKGCGYSNFVDAAIKIHARGVDAMFSILGSGSIAGDVRNEVESRGMLQRVVVIESLFDYARMWDPFDIAVVDTRQQAAAQMVLSAMANGRPVIATEGGAVFGLIEDGVDGMIVPRDDSDALAERIQLLVQNPAERLRMAKAAYAKIEEQFSPQDMGQEIARVYAALLADEPLPKPGKVLRSGTV